MTKVQEINVKDTTIRTMKVGEADYICITDIARQKNTLEPNAVVGNWMRNRNTIEYLGIWEYLNNPSFNPIEFEGFKQQAGLNAFTLSPSRWIEATNAIGLIAKSGRYGGTYAQQDIAFKFASWVSVEFELYLIKEFQRLKEEEQKAIGWSAKRELSKINYHIHTDAVRANLVPDEVDAYHSSLIYAEEADVLNVALFGMTAKEWREANPDKKGNVTRSERITNLFVIPSRSNVSEANMRDYATINQLICLSNMENLNAVFINEGIPQRDRLHKLNKIAIQQMTVLEEVGNRKLMK
jgi:hypothetical protein